MYGAGRRGSNQASGESKVNKNINNKNEKY
jgi:hypothetical protein